MDGVEGRTLTVAGITDIVPGNGEGVQAKGLTDAGIEEVVWPGPGAAL